MKTALELLKEKLVEIGADGMCNYGFGCGCKIGNLVPCYSGIPFDCVSAKNNPQKAVEMGFNYWMEPMDIPSESELVTNGSMETMEDKTWG